MLKKFFAMGAIFALSIVGCTKSTKPDFVYKIVTVDAWSASQEKRFLVLGKFDEAFVHLAEENQVERIAHKFFAGEDEVLVLKINPKKLKGRLVKEANPGGKIKYWHLYDGKIPLESIVSTTNLHLQKKKK